MTRIEIPLSKRKIFLTILGAVAFVFFSIIFIIYPHTFVSPILGDPALIRILGITGTILFGILGAYGIKKLSDRKAGLVIDAAGITDNTNATSVGHISWDDILDIRTEQMMSTKFLLIFITDPNRIIAQASAIKRRILKANMKMYGTPVSITSTTLQYPFEDLKKLLEDTLQEHRKKAALH